VGLVTGGVTGFLAMTKHNDLTNVCAANGDCYGQHDAIDSYHTMATISTVSFIVGGVAGAVGAVLLLTSPKTESPRAAIFVGPGSIGASGSF
jgi:hypothetical protein